MNETKKAIVIENICKSYNGKKVLDNFCADINIGETTCVMAPSGTGKTTLLRILMGLEPADSGTVRGMDGLKISAVFQEDRLCMNLDPISNIRLANPKLGKDTVMEALKSFGLGESTNIRTSELSGGMKRRVAIMRAVFAEYDILILDEPFKGLDLQTKDMVINETLKHTKNKTILLVTHDNSEKEKMCTQKCIML